MLEAGRRRLRPVLLTSMTTVAGLIPLLLETSFQAQILIPMAVSLSFGLIVATFLVLFLVPTFYSVYGRCCGLEMTPAEAEPPLHPAPAPVAAEPVIDSAAGKHRGTSRHP